MLDFERIERFQKEFVEIAETGVITVSHYEKEVHVTGEAFFENFTAFEGIQRKSENYDVELYNVVNGYTYYCVLNSDELK